MGFKPTRREAIQAFGLTAGALLLRIDTDAAGQAITVGGQAVELGVAAISPYTIRVLVAPPGARSNGNVLNADGALVDFKPQEKAVRPGRPVRFGDLTITASTSPIGVRVAGARRAVAQDLTIEADGTVHFLTGDAPLLGFGEGGAQFDRLTADRNGLPRGIAVNPQQQRAGCQPERLNGLASSRHERSRVISPRR